VQCEAACGNTTVIATFSSFIYSLEHMHFKLPLPCMQLQQDGVTELDNQLASFSALTLLVGSSDL